MKILSLNSKDTGGGAAIASYRLHRQFLKLGHDARMLVQSQASGDRTVVSSRSKFGRGLGAVKPTLDLIPLRFYPNREKIPYSLQCLPSQVDTTVREIDPDIVHLHWVNGGFVSVEAVARFNRPIVWTLHDMWGFTGGCHYSQGCDRYTKSCGSCPVLHSDRQYDLSRWLWRRKAKSWVKANLTIATPSKWLADLARTSSLFKDLRVEVVHNGLNTQVYRPLEQPQAREWLGLPKDKKIVLFGAVSATSDRRKGFHLLLPTLQQLKQQLDSESVELVVFGSSQPESAADFGFKVRYLGKLYDEISLALLYAAADVFIAPSVEDNLPNTVVEALACGTPCAAFKIGGMSEMIEHQQNGYLATPYQTEDLARGIAWLLADSDRWQKLSAAAVDRVKQKFTVEQQAQNYLQIYQEVLKK